MVLMLNDHSIRRYRRLCVFPFWVFYCSWEGYQPIRKTPHSWRTSMSLLRSVRLGTSYQEHDTRHDSPRSCRDAFSKKCWRIHKTRQNKKRSYKKRTRDLWNTRREIQTQTKLDQPSWKNGQHQTSDTRPQLQTSRKKRSWTPYETMATRRCRNRSIDLICGGRWWWIMEDCKTFFCFLIFPRARERISSKFIDIFDTWTQKCSPALA